MSETLNLLAPQSSLSDPGKSKIPWKDWIRLSNNDMTAAKYAELTCNRKKLLLIHLIGLEGQTV